MCLTMCEANADDAVPQLSRFAAGSHLLERPRPEPLVARVSEVVSIERVLLNGREIVVDGVVTRDGPGTILHFGRDTEAVTAWG